MNGLVRKAAVLAACGMLLGASASVAGIPDAAHSTIQDPTTGLTQLTVKRINLGGTNSVSGLSDATSAHTQLQVIVKDLAGAPVPNSTVIVDMSLAGDVRVSDNQPAAGMNAGCTNLGGPHTAFGRTDAAGSVTLVIGGAGGGAGGAHVVGLTPIARVFADGIEISDPIKGIGIGTFDENGGGIGLGDLSVWAGDYFNVTVQEDRSDFSGNGTLGLEDLSLWATAYFSLASNATTMTFCP